ncbi:MAG TPA: beta-N-acetylhexosaminidase [Bryobacteraceae bacterium]|nr:beta-N-acetylhexosaminidase [Bryobacteraceae bacterium]
MPAPRSVTVRSGALSIDSSFRVVLQGPSSGRVQSAVERFLHRLGRTAGITLSPVSAVTAGGTGAQLRIEWQQNGPSVPRLTEDESYAIEIDSTQARLRAPTSVGILRGLETLLQTMRTDQGPARFPAVLIQDQPRFVWRGLLLDCSRHFIPVPAIKRTLDGMAAFKYNVLHWHLSDDQGFRMESKAFPKLHGLGSDGLFYSQDDIRDIVSFAADRGIRVVPEFDMPGHATSWFVGYPELASEAGPYQIQRQAGLFEPVMNPSLPEVYAFLDSFIGEIVELFPDAYIHIGGDEVDSAQWKRSASVQAFMKSEGIGTAQGLQEYFNRRVQQILASRGRKMIGWDEILGAGLPPDATVQSWRGLSALAQTVRSGHPGILSFGYYLDQLQPAAEHYLVDPFDGEMAGVPAAERARILGGEACLWTEHISPENLDLRLWPRAAAIAERLWSSQQVRDVSAMYSRLEAARQYLKTVDIDLDLHRRRLLAGMADSASAEPLAILLETLRPVRAANRATANEIRPLVTLDRLVDTADPDSGASRLLLSSISEWSAHRQDIRARLTRWRDNSVAAKPILEQYPNLRETVPLAEHVRDLSSAALEAMDYLEQRRRPSRTWVTRQRQLLERAGVPQADLTITLVDTLRTLLGMALAIR